MAARQYIASRVVERHLAHRVAARYLSAIQKMTFYHGTGYRNLSSIASKGLQAKNGLSWGGLGPAGTMFLRNTKAVFLTSDFERAARYAQGSEKTQVPMVLEVQISSPRRFKNLRYDPLDRRDDAWDVQESYDEAADEVTLGIGNAIRGIGEKFGRSYLSAHGILPSDNDLESLDGVNIFKVATRYLMQELGLDRNQRRRAMQLVQEALGGESWEYMEVRPDGTLKLTEEYFYSREQLMFMRGLPPSTIKGVWVRLDDFGLSPGDVQETQEGGFKELPGEAVSRYEDIVELFKKLRWDAPSEMDQRALEEAVETARANDFDELADYLDDVAQTEPEDRPEMDDWDGELEGFEEELYGDWREERVLNPGVWGKVPLKAALRLRAAA